MADDSDKKIIPFKKPLPPPAKKKLVTPNDVHCIGFQGTDDRSWYIDDPDAIHLIFELLEREKIDLFRG